MNFSKWMKWKRLLFILISGVIFVLFLSYKKPGKAAVIFTFDDHYIESWYNCQSLFKEYEIRATFYINRPFQIDNHEARLLKLMAANGHEIGCHSMNHLHASKFLQKASLKQYQDKEISPAKKIFDSLGLKVHTFAYPFGEHTAQLDTVLLAQFSGLRLATYKWETASLDSVKRVFIKSGSGRVVNAISIDKGMLDLQDIEKAIRRVKRNHETLVLLAHGIDEVDGLYVPSDYLEEIFKICKKYHVKSITMNDFFSAN